MNWFVQNVTLATAIIAAVSALFGGLVASIAKFGFDFYLSERVKQRWKAADVTRRYSSPIIRAADDLAGRLENVHSFLKDGAASHWLRPISQAQRAKVPFDRYYFVSTVYLLGRLIAWIDLLRREETFLDNSKITEAQTFNRYTELVYQIISYSKLTGDDSERTSKNHFIYYFYLSGIGEAFCEKDSKGVTRVISFDKFCQKYRSAPRSGDFVKWVSELEAFFINLHASSEDRRWKRIQMLWLCLDKFLEVLDPYNARTTRVRSKSMKISDESRKQVTKQARRFNIYW